MLFRLNIGRKRSGGIGLSGVPVYYMPYWRAGRAQRSRVVYRPLERTLLHLLGISGMALLVLAVITWYAGFPWSAGGDDRQTAAEHRDRVSQKQIENLRELTRNLQRNLPPAEVAEIERRQAERQRELKEQLERSRSQLSLIVRAGHVLHWLSVCALAAVVVMPVAGFPLQRITIERSHDGELVIRKRGLWPSTRRWPGGTFGQIVIMPEEETARVRYTSYTIGWRWIVKLRVSPEVALELGPSLVDDPEIAFYIDFQKTRPANDELPPRSVNILVKHLRRLAGIESVARSELDPDQSGAFGRRRRTTTTTTVTSEPEVTQRVYHSLDEVPDHLRDEALQALKRARGSGSTDHGAVRVTIRDSDGNQQVYRSLNELPPEERARYEKAIRRARSKNRLPKK